MAGTQKRFAINVLMNWAATGVSMIVPFFLTPFVVRHLGAVGYGVWILAVSTVSYLGLLDLGLRSAVIRFVSKAQAQGLTKDAAAAIGAALWVRLLIAALVSVLSILLALATPHMFKLPPDFVHAAQMTVLLCALGLACTLASGVFAAVLAAINRFDVLSSITMVQTVARAGGVLLILRSGRGLVALACWELTIALLAGLATVSAAMVIFPASRTPVRRPEKALLKSLWSYSMTTFVLLVAVQIVFNTDSMVIGAFLSVGLVTFYSIGSSLVSYATQVSGALSTTFTPLASGLEASGRIEDLQRMLIRGSQGMLGIVLPIAVALIFRGKTFINLWMGPEYGEVSETVLRILMISLFLSMANGTAGAIMMAMDKHKPVARFAALEALLNLGLSIVLAKTIGLYGVAWGTSISMLLTHLGFWPRYINKTLGVPPRRYIWQGWGKVTLCSLPFAAVCAVAEHFWHPTNLAVFFAQILITLPVYALSVLAVFGPELRSFLQTRRATARLAQV